MTGSAERTPGSQTATRARVVFVDDEPHLLAGLRRMLYAQRARWDIAFVASGVEALDLFERGPVDAIVSDMRMPSMDGAQLLAAVQRDYPSTARIVLSGEADRASVLAVLRSAQQFLAKPCDADTLVGAVERALAVQRLLAAPHLRKLIGGVSSLPTLPAVYHELIGEMDAPDVDMDRVARLLASDVATSAELLKLVNSAFFGLPREVLSVHAAVSLLGLDNIRALMVTGCVFRVSNSSGPNAQIEQLREFALRRAAISRVIAGREDWPQHERNLGMLSCMLRDVGALVLTEGMPGENARLAAVLAAEHLVSPARCAQLEVEAYGCTVPQASAYLLGLWAFPPAVVYTVANQPVTGPGPGITRLEQVLEFAHRRALDPLQLVSANADEFLGAERMTAWSSAADGVMSEHERRADHDSGGEHGRGGPGGGRRRPD